MKKFFLLMLMAFAISFNLLKAQGTDYIICIDNSGSIGGPAYDQISISTKKLIENILACNPKNRVAVTHYGTGVYGIPDVTYNPRIYIESDFTNNIAVAQNFTRRLEAGDHFHEALGLIGDALDNNPNPDIVSPQPNLHRDPNAPLVIILFTDAQRAAGDLESGSYLVNYYDTTYGSPGAFKNVSFFKKDRKTKFAVVHVSPDSYSTEAAASIASAGGSYFGPVESNTDDIDYGISPRLYFGKTDFLLTTSEIFEITRNVCDNQGGGSINMYYEPNDCGGFNSVQSVLGTYDLPSGAILQGLQLSIVSLSTGDEYPVSFNPTMTAPNQYHQTLTASDFGAVPASAMYGQFKFLITMTYEVGGQTYQASAWNNNPFATFDINFGCTRGVPNTQLDKKNRPDFKLDRNSNPNHFRKNSENVQKFQLTPNPTKGQLNVVLNKGFENGSLQVLDLNGSVIYKTTFKNQKQLTIDLTEQKEGVYIVNILSDKNEIYTEKIIKK
ncbi:T9SS type A sorting domain-containing protein [Chryseobacterium sp. MMS23-Vi53]|uniref:T9SS type A sorting domain-containing protein n=1 Tax=Chryseobacterium sp. MMS23-Vi53 TaxID=3386644 RepID=UPI0039E92004